MSGATAAAASGAFAATSGGGNLRQQEQRAPSGPRPPHPARALRGTGLTAARQVWELTDTKKCGFLDLQEFEAALKLIALAQRNGGSVDYAVSAEVLRGGGPPVGLPRLQGLETEAAAPPSPAPGPSPAGASGAQWPPLSEAEVEKYKGLFRSLDPAGQGVVQGGAVFPVFMQSGLPKDRLKAIWDLVAGDRGYLSLPELITSLYLVQAALLFALRAAATTQVFLKKFERSFPRPVLKAVEESLFYEKVLPLIEGFAWEADGKLA